MRLSRTIVYALQTMIQLAEVPSEEAISRGQLAAAGQLPERFLLEILHSLVARGFVRSIRGVGGGFALAKPMEDITLRDLFQAFDFPHQPFVPTVDGQPPAVREQVLETVSQAHIAAVEEFEKLTLAEVRQIGLASGISQSGHASNPNGEASKLIGIPASQNGAAFLQTASRSANS